MSNTVKVEIYNQTYYVGGELDQNYVTQLASYVDAKMRAIAETTRTVDSLRIAVLAALAIADELHSARSNQGEHSDGNDVENLLRERAQHCLRLVEQALKQSA